MKQTTYSGSVPEWAAPHVRRTPTVAHAAVMTFSRSRWSKDEFFDVVIVGTRVGTREGNRPWHWWTATSSSNAEDRFARHLRNLIMSGYTPLTQEPIVFGVDAAGARALRSKGKLPSHYIGRVRNLIKAGNEINRARTGA